MSKKHDLLMNELFTIEQLLEDISTNLERKRRTSKKTAKKANE